MTYKTRYAAQKARDTHPEYSNADMIVKVEGGYTIMTAWDYRVWRKQK